MPLAYFPEELDSPDGVAHRVLDASGGAFGSDPRAAFGVKATPTFAIRARPGQAIRTAQDGLAESAYECSGGEPIFANILPDGSLDAYVPRDAEGRCAGEAILASGYSLAEGGLDDPAGGLYLPRAAPCRILREAIEIPTAIKDAFGPGCHQFLSPGATLKFAAGRATGINKAAFDATWALADEDGAILRPPAEPSCGLRSRERFLALLDALPMPAAPKPKAC